MRSFFHTCKHLIGAVLLLGVPACDWIHDDSLPPCEFRLHYVYDYNMKFADAFQHEVDRVSLFICDQDGNFLSQRLIEGAELKENDIRLDLEPGTYQLLSWAGLHDESYELPEPVPGKSTVRDIRVRTRRNTDGTQPDELRPLWHSLDTIHVSGTSHEEQTIGLDKDTNKLRLVLQNVKGKNLDVNDFTFRIVADNGYMDYDNSLLPDPAITYLPYYTENAEIAADPDPAATVADQLVAVAEMNTMRLMAGENYRLIVRHKAFKDDVLNINLNNYLLLTKMEGHKIPAQEYLDRQDEYSIIFFLTPVECPDCPDPDPKPDPDPDPKPDPDPDPDPDPEVPVIGYKCFVIWVNDWVIRLNDIDL
ncbi:FimB/Mfa2 family fimbrial subunit [Parabacteroides sp.]|uniref:FimB/Mfa2 family fimbrial subunit n=1 Tax=Parabacteroides sp. TaxID=1869337 RepID=UPI00257FB172|nr:FimB/Mfa2 family fimbrial subunit [Parabacteroides sp.]